MCYVGFSPTLKCGGMRSEFPCQNPTWCFLLSFLGKGWSGWNSGWNLSLVFFLGCTGSLILGLFKRKHQLSNLLSKIGCCSSLLEWKGTICFNNTDGGRGKRLWNATGRALGHLSSTWRSVLNPPTWERISQRRLIRVGRMGRASAHRQKATWIQGEM